MLPCRAFVVLSAWLFVLPSESISSDTTRTWDVPRFSAEGRTLYKAASSVTPKAGTDVVVLDEEENYVFDADGKAIRTHYLVYKVLTQKGSEGWDDISLGWEPWHEERPTVRARVITPDSVIHALDPKTVTIILAPGPYGRRSFRKQRFKDDGTRLHVAQSTATRGDQN
jgi:hypothetical protein